MLNRTAQYARTTEATEGTPESLTTSHYRGNFKELDYAFAPMEYERGLVRPSLSPLPNLKGQRLLKITALQELVGGAAAVAAPWHDDLLGLGFERLGLKVLTVGLITIGTTGYQPGETLGNHASEGSATKTARFIAQFAVGGANKVVVLPITGTFADTDLVKGYTSGATSTQSGAAANGGYTFRPITETESDGPDSLTVAMRKAGRLLEGAGARSTGSLTMRVGEPLLLRTEATACIILDDDDPTPAEGAFLAGVPSMGDAPRVAKGASLKFYDDWAAVHNPVLTELTINFNNTLAPRATISECVSDSGYLPTRITGRDFRCSIDPEAVAPSVFEHHARHAAGATFEIYGVFGKAGDAHGIIVIHAPAAQLQGDLTIGDRDGVATYPAEAKLCEGSTGDDELYVSHVFL